MAQEKASFEIVRMARLLRVSRQGYYVWRARRDGGLGPQAARREQIDAAVRASHQASDEVYGAPRITADLHDEGLPVNVKTVAASMRRQGLEGISLRMFAPVTTIPGTPTHRIPDRVKRQWDTGELNRVWISDITYLRTGEGWLYLCVVRDACSRRVLGWAMDSHQDADLVERRSVPPRPCVDRSPARSSSTPIAARSTPRPNSIWPARNSTSINRWGVPGCVSITLWPSRSSPR